LKNLYVKVVPTGRLTLAVHSGLDDVYEPADSGIADEVDQEPSWLIDPVRKIFWPNDVVTNSLKVTETLLAGVAHAPVVVVLLVVVVKVVPLVVVDPPPEPPIEISAQLRYAWPV
jgi:hypothetical protein